MAVPRRLVSLAMSRAADRAGTPATTAPGATSCVTTAPAPTSGPLADRHAAQDDRARADRGSAADARRDDFPVGLGLQPARRAWPAGRGR